MSDLTRHPLYPWAKPMAEAAYNDLAQSKPGAHSWDECHSYTQEIWLRGQIAALESQGARVEVAVYGNSDGARLSEWWAASKGRTFVPRTHLRTRLMFEPIKIEEGENRG